MKIQGIVFYVEMKQNIIYFVKIHYFSRGLGRNEIKFTIPALFPKQWTTKITFHTMYLKGFNYILPLHLFVFELFISLIN